MRVLAVANQKGGCGKTTSSINLAACMAFLKKKTLLIDLDPQGHSACGLGVKIEKSELTTYELLSSRYSPKPSFSAFFRQIHPDFHLIPSQESLAAFEEELAGKPEREKVLSKVLSDMKQQAPDIDYVIIDCPPNLGSLTANAFEACDEIIIPIEPSFFSLHGLAKIFETLKGVNSNRINPIRIHALLTIFEARTRFAKEVYDEVQDHFEEDLFKTIIHESVLFKEAASAGQSIVDYEPNSQAFRDYLNLAMEYLERDWNRRLPEKNLGWDQVVSHRYGPRRVAGGILFQAMTEQAGEVEIAGDFNNWIPEPLIARASEEGLWQKVIPIPSGRYRYKFIVDGEWQLDPYQPMKAENDFGTQDSCLELN